LSNTGLLDNGASFTQNSQCKSNNCVVKGSDPNVKVCASTGAACHTDKSVGAAGCYKVTSWANAGRT
jgi:hypothetical protein